MDIALGIEALIPAAQYFGSTTANDKNAFDNLTWLDERAKPTWKQVQDAFDALPEEIKNPEILRTIQRTEILNRLGLTADEAKLLLG